MTKQAQHFDMFVGLIILVIAAVLIITLYYAWTGKLAGLRPPWL